MSRSLVDCRFSLLTAASMVLLVGLAATHVHGFTLEYDAGPAGGGPADLDPVLQGWLESEVNDGSSDPAEQNVFFLQPDGSAGLNATLLDDQHGGTPTDNPRYQIFLNDQHFAAMYENGWVYEFRFRPVEGTNFTAWGINPSTAADPGWNLGDRKRVGFTIGLDASDQSAVVSPVAGDSINLGPGSADSYHTVRAVGAPQSSQYELFVDGISQATLDIADGSSNSSGDNRIYFESGSSGGTGRSVAWNLVRLEFVPEPGVLLLASLALMGIGCARPRF